MRKENLTYYFSVEGQTEKMYLDWLQSCINKSSEAKYTVKLDTKVEKDPVSRVKRMSVLGRTEITHVFDRESEDPIHTRQFEKTLCSMKEAQRLGKDIKYVLGYSNFTFELWIILHKADCNGAKAHRQQYLAPLNAAFHEHFNSLDEYKREDNFQRILKQLSLGDVKEAIRRSEQLMQHNDECFERKQYKGYSFYAENPSLSIWESIKKILHGCGLL